MSSSNTFSTDLEHVEQKIKAIDPDGYARSRNFLDGSVTRLSPYISRGVISTKQVFQHIKTLNLPYAKCEKLIQELAWRDYWQQIWLHKDINNPLKRPQEGAVSDQMPLAVLEANTGISAVDEAIKELYETGYMHNHMRMYVASIVCNVAKIDFMTGARWMYYHLLDADWASNVLSWQWVCGANANKKYYANQENINKYCKTNDQGTFLDVPYQAFERLEIPEVLLERKAPDLNPVIPNTTKQLEIDEDKPTFLYNFYNLDAEFGAGLSANRIFLIEPSVFECLPISASVLEFSLALSKNIKDIQVFYGEFSALQKHLKSSELHYKAHPLNNYKGIEHQRDFMFDVQGYFPSFFGYFKCCKKQIEWPEVQ